MHLYENIIKLNTYNYQSCIKIIPLFLCMLINFTVKSNDFEYIMNSHYTLDSNLFNFTDGTSYASFKMLGSWTDNYGNFGSNNCGGQFESNKKKQVKIYGVCEVIDSKDNKRWITLERDFGVEQVGAGKSVQIDSGDYWSFLNGIKCGYGIEHGKKYSYSITKCKINREMHNALSQTKR